MTIGTVITIAPAAIEPVGSSNCELPVKLAIATGAVIDALVAVSDNEIRRGAGDDTIDTATAEDLVKLFNAQIEKLEATP